MNGSKAGGNQTALACGAGAAFRFARKSRCMMVREGACVLAVAATLAAGGITYPVAVAASAGHSDGGAAGEIRHRSGPVVRYEPAPRASRGGAAGGGAYAGTTGHHDFGRDSGGWHQPGWGGTLNPGWDYGFGPRLGGMNR